MPPRNRPTDFIIDAVREVYRQLPFNRLLGLEVAKLDVETSVLKLDMRRELIGNYVQGILHGGVISAMLDVTGGITATSAMLHRLEVPDYNTAISRISRVGTIDLRVDYLRPGKGNGFISKGSIMRAGRKVAVARMELTNTDGRLIAVGTGTYLVG